MRSSFRRPAWMAAAAACATALSLGGVPTATARHPLERITAAPAAAVKQPNIVLILTDDQTITDLRWMPKTRRLLGGSGTTFSHGISPQPLCCPARAEIVTGQYAQHNGVYSNTGVYGGFQALRDKGNTIGRWLQDAGYNTALVGKYLNGYISAGAPRQQGWTFWDPTISDGGSYVDFTQYNNGDVTRHRGDYITDYVRDQTRALVERWSRDTRPFFIWAAYFAPHKTCRPPGGCSYPPVPAPRHTSLYPNAVNPAQRKPSFNERDMSDKPPQIRNVPRLDAAKRAWIHRLFLGRIRSLAAVDEAVQDTVRVLRETGELDNTLIIFSSDNGFMLGEHRLVYKLLAFEESLRVPFLVRGPGVPAGRVRRDVVTTVDIAPTLVDVAGARPGRLMDGESMRPYWRGTHNPVPQTELVQGGFDFGHPGTTRWMYRGVRAPRYTYTRWNTGFEELYDRRLDPYQLRNRASDLHYRHVRAVLRRRLAVLRACAGSGCQRTFGGTIPLPARRAPTEPAR